jgi:hypothetical protein
MYAIYDIYQHYKEKVFPRLLEDPNIPIRDKDIIRGLLQKPFNPYIQRHYALSEKAKILKESVLRVHAGWLRQRLYIYRQLCAFCSQ